MLRTYPIYSDLYKIKNTISCVAYREKWGYCVTSVNNKILLHKSHINSGLLYDFGINTKPKPCGT